MQWDNFKENFCNIKEGFIFKTIRIKETVFMKEYTETNELLADLENEFLKNPDNNNIKNDIIRLKQGLKGEKSVAFELKNSNIPMIVLHDIRLGADDNFAQFDYILITENSIYVIECKNLSGNIEITKKGDFNRTIYWGKNFRKEGMYSPIIQNERHLAILKKILIENNIIESYPVKSIIVMSNEKSIINDTSAPKSIKESVVRIDQLVNFIKDNDLQEEKKFGTYRNSKIILGIANFLLENNTTIKYDLRKKYCLDADIYCKDNNDKIINKDTDGIQNQKRYDWLYAELKKYRLYTSKKEGIAPYMVYTNDELESLINLSPKNLNNILSLRGFGNIKTKKYGSDILDIFKNCPYNLIF